MTGPVAALGRVFEALPGPRRLARHLAALSEPMHRTGRCGPRPAGGRRYFEVPPWRQGPVIANVLPGV